MINKANILICYIFSIYPIVAFIALKFTNITAANIIIILLFLLLPMVLITRKPSEINFPTYLKFYLAFLIIALFSDYINGEIDSLFEYAYRDTYIKSFFLLFVIENTYYHSSFINNLKKILFIILVLSFIVILMQVVIGPSFLVRSEFFIDKTIDQYRAPSIFSWIDNPTALGFSIPMIISILASENYLNNFKRNNYLLFFLGGIISLINRSRWVMISMFVISIQAVKYSGKKTTIIFKYAIAIVVFLIFSYQIMMFSGMDVNKIIEERILETNKKPGEETSAGTRILAFYMFVEFFPDNPIFGTGGVMKDDLVRTLRGRSSQIHVGFLSLFYYYGLVGGSIFLAFFFYLFKQLRFVAQKTDYWGSYYALLTFPIANLTLVSFDLFNMGVVMAIVFHKYYEQQLLFEYESDEIET